MRAESSTLVSSFSPRLAGSSQLSHGRGFFVLHQHVTPHIGTTGKTRVLSEAAKDARVAPVPGYNYAVEAELVLDRLKVLDDRKKMQVEWFDDKLNLILTMFGTLVGSGVVS